MSCVPVRSRGNREPSPPTLTRILLKRKIKLRCSELRLLNGGGTNEKGGQRRARTEGDRESDRCRVLEPAEKIVPDRTVVRLSVDHALVITSGTVRAGVLLRHVVFGLKLFDLECALLDGLRAQSEVSTTVRRAVNNEGCRYVGIMNGT